jgi:hypothetical protein
MAKIVNYTNEQTELLIKTYKQADTEGERADVVSYFATEFGKKIKSIVAKLSRAEVYVKAEKKTKTGGEIVTKEELTTRIAESMNFVPETFSSLSNANKGVLTNTLEFINTQKVRIAELENNILALQNGEPEIGE